MLLPDDDEDSSRLASYIKLIGSFGALASSYLLMAAGVLSLLMSAYHAWLLYIDPNTISVFTDVFLQTAPEDQKSDISVRESYWIASWPIVIFLLLILAKIGVWSIDAAVHLLNTIQYKRQKEE